MITDSVIEILSVIGVHTMKVERENFLHFKLHIRAMEPKDHTFSQYGEGCYSSQSSCHCNSLAQNFQQGG